MGVVQALARVDDTRMEQHGINHLSNPVFAEAGATFAEALICRDRVVACDLVASLARRYGAFAVVDFVVAPAMRQIGDLWECGDVDVATEHAATFVAREALATIQRTCERRSWLPTARRVVAFAPAQELHELPVVMVAAALESMGWQTLTLGCDLPAHSTASMTRMFGADVACMSLSTAAAADGALASVQALMAIPGKRPEIWIGGGALAEDEALAERLRAAGASVVGASIGDLARIAQPEPMLHTAARAGYAS